MAVLASGREGAGMLGQTPHVAADHRREPAVAADRPAMQVVRSGDRQAVPRQDQGEVGKVRRLGVQGAVEVEDVDVAGLHRHVPVAAPALEAPET